MIRILSLIFLLWPGVLRSQATLTQFDGCRLIETDWGDGDSFQLLTERGKEMNIRLYGVDCIETQASSEADVTRLRAQRRYFGIYELGENGKDSVVMAMKLGTDARDEVRKALKLPFTVFTAFADGRGDPRFDRVYAFVLTSDGKDLGEHLVSQGLARAHGVYRSTPSGQSRDEYQESLKDLELQAAKEERGIWARTDWRRLPDERREQRRDDLESEIATGGGKLLEGESVNVNKASRDDLMRIPQIAEGRALNIIESRPYSKIEDLLKADGIGEGLLEIIAPYLRFADD